MGITVRCLVPMLKRTQLIGVLLMFVIKLTLTVIAACGQNVGYLNVKLTVNILITGLKGVSRFGCVRETLCCEVGTENLKLLLSVRLGRVKLEM